MTITDETTTPRRTTLIQLAETMRAAAEADDTETMQRMNSAIYRLLGGPRSPAIERSAIERSFDYIARETAAGRPVRGHDALRVGLQSAYLQTDSDARRLLAAGLIEDRGQTRRAFWATTTLSPEEIQTKLDEIKATSHPARPSRALTEELLALIAAENAQGRGAPSVRQLTARLGADRSLVDKVHRELLSTGAVENRGTALKPAFWVVPDDAAESEPIAAE